MKTFRFLATSGHKNVTLSAKRKMSQRQKRHRSSRSTQTEETGVNSLTNSPKNISREGLAAGGSTGGEDDMAPSSSTSHSGPDGEFYEEQAALYERLVKAEEVSILSLCILYLGFIDPFSQIFRLIEFYPNHKLKLKQ